MRFDRWANKQNDNRKPILISFHLLANFNIDIIRRGTHEMGVFDTQHKNGYIISMLLHIFADISQIEIFIMWFMPYL